MTDPSILTCENGRAIAYHYHAGDGPCIVFLGGFKSDMSGTKAVYLEAWAKAQNRTFLRLDYSGHGQSSGTFEEGCIGDWFADARAVIDHVVDGQVVLVGSSMGGWISLLLARDMPHKISGLVGIAAAPDFTEDSMWNGFSDAQKAELLAGQVALPSEYGDPYIITRHLIEDGRKNLVLRGALELPFATRFLQGTADMDVDMSVALRLLAHATGGDIQLSLIKGADHRFSTPDCLSLIKNAITDVVTSGKVAD